MEVVGESAFENNQKVQFVVIPKSVKRLDAYVFWGCNNLEEVVLGKGLTAVDEYSFAGCTGLKQITIPENIQSIDAQAFAGCVNLTDIYIPATVTGIAEDAFLNCDNVTIHADEGSVAAQFAQKLAEQKNRDPLVTAAPVQTPTAVSRPDTQATTEPVSTATPAPVATPVPGNVLGSTIIVGNHALVMVHPGEEKYSRGIRNRKRDKRPVKNRISQLRQRTARFRNGCIIVTSLSAQLRSRKVLQRSDVLLFPEVLSGPLRFRKV